MAKATDHRFNVSDKVEIKMTGFRAFVSERGHVEEGSGRTKRRVQVYGLAFDQTDTPPADHQPGDFYYGSQLVKVG